jgi:hypothetical protein
MSFQLSCFVYECNAVNQFDSLLWAGKLSFRVSEPAGGSLTADEYKLAASAPWEIIVSPFLTFDGVALQFV